MNKNRIIKISNAIGLISIIFLVYWIFIFISITVFGLKVFRENITESFRFSIIGILSLMFGALMINIMLNLTKISEYIDKSEKIQKVRKIGFSSILIISSFPLIFGLLYVGDKLTSNKKKKYLIKSAQYLTEQHQYRIKQLVDYSFTSNYIKQTEKILNYLSKMDKNFPHVFVIAYDKIDNSPTFIRIRDYKRNWETKEPDDIISYIYSCTKEEREYLKTVFNDNNDKPRFSSYDGKYELFYPIIIEGKKIVLYFSEYQKYGKFGL